jgi:hypothetical protein
MTTTEPTDAWASTDHDPICTPHTTVHRALITTKHALSLARADIHDAVANEGDTRRTYALSAADYAAMVILADDATRAQREYAFYYLADAEALAAH